MAKRFGRALESKREKNGVMTIYPGTSSYNIPQYVQTIWRPIWNESKDLHIEGKKYVWMQKKTSSPIPL